MSATETISEYEIGWQPPPGDFELRDSETHVWAASLNIPETKLPHLRSALSTAELDRADRFRFDTHRNRFIAGRALLRSILAHYLRTEPGQLQFNHGPNGKPMLAGQRKNLRFNLAHSEDLALVAVTSAGQIGVDVEHVRILDDFEELVARFFSTREAQRFRQLPPGDQPAAFFSLWTRKEAWLKATGEGIVHSLKYVEVSFLPGEPARFLRLPNSDPEEWQLHELAPARQFTAALATNSEISMIRCWRWPEHETLSK